VKVSGLARLSCAWRSIKPVASDIGMRILIGKSLERVLRLNEIGELH
jgi:hypothetical protein